MGPTHQPIRATGVLSGSPSSQTEILVAGPLSSTRSGTQQAKNPVGNGPWLTGPVHADQRGRRRRQQGPAVENLIPVVNLDRCRASDGRGLDAQRQHLVISGRPFVSQAHPGHDKKHAPLFQVTVRRSRLTQPFRTSHLQPHGVNAVVCDPHRVTIGVTNPHRYLGPRWQIRFRNLVTRF